MNKLRSEEQIQQSWIDENHEPLVSICCFTYNHEKYIEDAIFGILKQVTSFPIEVIIHDDASTDGTTNIINKYKKLYPSIIKTVLQKENQYSKGEKVSLIVYKKCKGKYIAMCDGDDYWIDENKIEIQANYLESNPNVSMSCHNAKMIDEHGNCLVKQILPYNEAFEFSKNDLILNNYGTLTLTKMFRNINIENCPEIYKVLNVDTFLNSLIGQYGGGYFHTDIKLSVYRSHDQGLWSGLDNKKMKDEQINTYFWIYRYYDRLKEIFFADCYRKKYQCMVLSQLDFFSVTKEFFTRLFLLRQIKGIIKK